VSKVKKLRRRLAALEKKIKRLEQQAYWPGSWPSYRINPAATPLRSAMAESVGMDPPYPPGGMVDAAAFLEGISKNSSLFWSDLRRARAEIRQMFRAAGIDPAIRSQQGRRTRRCLFVSAWRRGLDQRHHMVVFYKSDSARFSILKPLASVPSRIVDAVSFLLAKGLADRASYSYDEEEGMHKVELFPPEQQAKEKRRSPLPGKSPWRCGR
jgi:hypothetical protein